MKKWIKWNGGECPVGPDVVVEVKHSWRGVLRAEAQFIEWEKSNSLDDIISYRVIKDPCGNPYVRQLKDGQTEIDVYGVLRLYKVKDPEIQHAIKKLLCPGKRGVKTKTQDVIESIKSLERYVDEATS